MSTGEFGLGVFKKIVFRSYSTFLFNSDKYYMVLILSLGTNQNEYPKCQIPGAVIETFHSLFD